MPKRPPERYASGELEQTRKNLGILSQEEARKMTRLLGGEIGIEQGNSRVDNQYKKLKDLNRRRNDTPLSQSTTSLSNRRDIHEAFEYKARPAVPTQKLKPGFVDRVRTAFLASRPEHRLLRRFDAWLLLLFPFLNRRLKINPGFLKAEDKLFYDHIEHFVLSIRSLLARNRQYAIYRIKPGYCKTLLYVFRNWNIEGIHVELSKLQTHPRNTTVESTAHLFRDLFKPFIILSALDIQTETEKALKHLFDLTLLSVPKDGKEAGIIKELYISARNEIYHVTSAIPRQCWPILLYHTDSGYTDYDELIHLHRGTLHSFLGTKEEDILLPPTPEDEKIEIPENPSEENQVDPEEEYADLQETACTLGLSILSELFPNSGWNNAETWPDLVPFFKTLCTLPRGVDILSPEDPIHQITILISILAELYSGFRYMKFKKEPGKDEDNPGQILEGIIDSWHLLTEELLTKHYILPLIQYCRQFERDPDFEKSTFAEKIQSELSWIKRYYITPFSYTGAFKGSRPVIQKKLPKLFETVSDLTQILSRIILSAENPAGGILENSESSFHFEVPGYIPLRVKAILQRKNEPVSNLNLLKTVHGIISVLDYQVNNVESWFYGSENEIFFRNDYHHGSAPVYSVESLDSAGIIRLADEEERLDQTELKPPPLDGPEEAKIFLEHTAARLEKHQELSIITFRMRKASESGETELLGQFIGSQIREHIDKVFLLKKGLLLLVLPETSPESAGDLALRLIEEIKDHSESLYNPAAGVSTYHTGFSTDQFIISGRRAAERALEHPDQPVICYLPKEHRFKTVKEKSPSSEIVENDIE